MHINAKNGYFKGYASVFDTPDLTNDIVAPGAFRSSLARRGARGVKMLYQHDPQQVIGLWHRLVEDRFGLYVEGSLLLDVTRAGEIFSLLEAKALDGLSIGFRTIRAQPTRTNYRIVKEVDLAEISIVTFPMHPEARVHQVLGDKIETPSPRLGLASSLRQAALKLNGINSTPQPN